MTIAEQKLEIIQKIILTNDVELLMKIKEILFYSNDNFEVNESKTAYSKTGDTRVFNEWQQAKIDKALQQYNNGECISDEEAQKEIQAWLED